MILGESPKQSLLHCLDPALHQIGFVRVSEGMLTARALLHDLCLGIPTWLQQTEIRA